MPSLQFLQRLNPKNNVLAKNTLWMISGYTTKIAIQAVYFVLVSNFLGPSELGAFVGIVSLVNLLQPFARLGSGEVLIRHVAISPERFRIYWGAALSITLVSGSLLSLLTIGFAPFAIGSSVSLPVIIAVTLADTLLASLSEISGQCFIAVEKLNRTARLAALQSMARLIGAFCLYAYSSKIHVAQWSLVYLCASLICSIYALTTACRELGMPRIDLAVIRAFVKEGVGFALGQSASGINMNLDKVLLTRLATLKDCGIYGAATRLTDVAFAPAQSLLFAAAARTFKQGSRGFASVADFVKQLLPFACGYSIAAGLALFLGAPIIPRLLGSGFHDSIEAIRWLSPLILFRTLSAMTVDMISSLGKSYIRAVVQISMALLSLVLNLALIPSYTWHGSAWVALTTNGLIAAGFLAVLFNHFYQRSRRPFVEPTVANSQA